MAKLVQLSNNSSCEVKITSTFQPKAFFVDPGNDLPAGLTLMMPTYSDPDPTNSFISHNIYFEILKGIPAPRQKPVDWHVSMWGDPVNGGQMAIGVKDWNFSARSGVSGDSNHYGLNDQIGFILTDETLTAVRK